MALQLSKFESFVGFCGFLLLSGGMVASAYWLIALHAEESPEAKVVAVAPEAPAAVQKAPVLIQPPAPTVQPAAKAPAAPPAEVSRRDVLVNTFVHQSIPTPPTTEPARTTVAIAPVPSTRVETPAVFAPHIEPATRPATTVKVVQLPPVVKSAPAIAKLAPVIVEMTDIRLPASRVIHMFADESSSACWYDLKLDRQQVDQLRSALAYHASVRKWETDEYDRIADAPPAPPAGLRWWRPVDLVDVNVLSFHGNGQRLWAGISMRTGKVLIYSNHPISFSGAER